MSKRLTPDQSGAALVEFSLVLAPLLVVVMGFMELGYQSYVRSVLQGSLNDVARLASVETPRFGDSSQPLETRIQNRLKQRMSPLVRSGTYEFDISNYKDFASVGRPEALVTDVNGNGQYDDGDCWKDTNPNGTFDLDGARSGVGGADDVVVYHVNLSAPHLLPVGKLIGVGSSFNAKAATMIRTQPYDQQIQAAVEC